MTSGPRDGNGNKQFDLANASTYLGSPVPKTIFGVNTRFTNKSFDPVPDLQGVTGNKTYKGKRVDIFHIALVILGDVFGMYLGRDRERFRKDSRNVRQVAT